MSVAAPPHPGGPPGAPAPAPEIPFLKTVKPSGKPPWPLVLLAGVEKCGKSYAAAEFSGSDLIGRTFWIEIGEGDANHYGEVPGARYEIVPHDGSYKGIGWAAWAASKQLRVDGRPNAIVIDNVTLLWEMLTAEAQAIANRRRRNPDAEATITMDLWNVAKKRWGDFIDVLRAHDGPVILIARLEYVTLMDANSQPTKDKDWKIRAEKNLPFEVDVVVTMPAYRTYEISGVRSLRLQIPPGEKHQIPDFTTDLLMRRLRLDAAGSTQPRVYVPPRPDPDDAAATIIPADAVAPLRGAPAQLPPGNRHPGPQEDRADAEQVRVMMELLDAIGPAGPDARLELVSGILGVRVSGPGDLTRRQADLVISTLHAQRSGADDGNAPAVHEPESDETGPSDANSSSLPHPLPTIPALKDIAAEPPRFRPGVEDFDKSLADARNLEAVERVEARIIRDFNATAFNNTRFVDLTIAVAERRAALGAAPQLNPAAAAMASILARAASKKRSIEDVGRIHALIHHHAEAGTLPVPEALQLLAQCMSVYQAVATHAEERSQSAA